MSKKNKTSRKTNKELLREAREEGMFKEAREFTRKKKYKVASTKDGIGIYLMMVVAFIVIAIINRILGI